MEAYIYTYVNKETGKTYIGSRSAYKGSCYDDFNIKYFSSSKDKQFRQDMADGKLEGQIVLVMNCENANKKIVEVEHKMIDAYWDKYGRENSYNKHNNGGKWNNSGNHRKLSDERKKAIGLRSLGNKNMLGKHHSEETKKLLSNLFKGRKKDAEWVQKIVLSKKGYKHSEETKAKMRKPKPKLKWITPNNEIIEMTRSSATRCHPDWKLLN